MHVRVADRDDWPAVEPLLHGMGFTAGQSARELRDRFERFVAHPRHCLLVAEAGGRIVGYAWAQDFGPHLRLGSATVRLHDLFVAPDARRRGAGRALFDGVRGWAEQREARWFQWQAGRDSLGFYAALGIAPTPTDEGAHPFYELELRGDA